MSTFLASWSTESFGKPDVLRTLLSTRAPTLKHFKRSSHSSLVRLALFMVNQQLSTITIKTYSENSSFDKICIAWTWFGMGKPPSRHRAWIRCEAEKPRLFWTSHHEDLLGRALRRFHLRQKTIFWRIRKNWQKQYDVLTAKHPSSTVFCVPGL